MNDDSKTRILQAAGEAFSKLGFENATVREICKEAAVNVAAVNYHFGDKERLYIETLKYAHRFRADQVPLPEWPPGTSAETKLRDFIGVTMQRLLAAKELPWQARLMMREIAEPTGACHELAQDYIRPHFELLLRVLDELVPPRTPSHERKRLAFSVIGQCLFYRVHQPVIDILLTGDERARQFAVDQLADHIANVTLAALGVRPLFR